MKKITYERVSELITNYEKMARPDFPDSVNIKYGDSDIAIVTRSLIDSINEQITWKVLTVSCKTEVHLSRETNYFKRMYFPSNTNFKCIGDKDTTIILLHEDESIYETPKDWFYIK